MPYKDKKGMIQTAIKLNDKQKEKLFNLMNVNVNGMEVQLSATKLLNKIVTDYLDSLPDSNNALIDDTEASKDTKIKRHTNTTKDSANSSK